MKSLITGHLEKISSRVFEDYHQEITTLVGKHHGVYALYKKNRLYYVGLATNLRSRVKHHLKDRHSQKWDSFSIFLIHQVEHLRELEALILHIAEPKGNMQLGKLSASKLLKHELRRLIRIKNSEKEESIFGNQKAEKKKDKSKLFAKYRTTPGKPGLQGVLPAGAEIYAPYKGTTYSASITEEGKILYDGKIFNSPSRAAKAIYGERSVNGWVFWRFKDKSGKLKALRTLMK